VLTFPPRAQYQQPLIQPQSPLQYQQPLIQQQTQINAPYIPSSLVFPPVKDPPPPVQIRNEIEPPPYIEVIHTGPSQPPNRTNPQQVVIPKYEPLEVQFIRSELKYRLVKYRLAALIAMLLVGVLCLILAGLSWGLKPKLTKAGQGFYAFFVTGVFLTATAIFSMVCCHRFCLYAVVKSKKGTL